MNFSLENPYARLEWLKGWRKVSKLVRKGKDQNKPQQSFFSNTTFFVSNLFKQAETAILDGPAPTLTTSASSFAKLTKLI